MQYIYHGVPEKMEGNTLMPLNLMPNFLDEIYEKNIKKYEGREEILERRIPLLDRLWNDVLQFLPFDPIKVFELQVSLGLISKMPHYRFYKIPLGQLDVQKTAVFFKTAPGEENTEVKWLEDVDFANVQDVPLATVNYYKTLIGTGVLPFNYQFIPHVLYAGTVDISGLQIITL
jgi:hypothetical protein